MIARFSAVVLSYALAALFVAGCGGKKGTIEIDIVVSPIDDPFISASEVRFTVGTQMKSVPVTNGHFSFDLGQKPPDNPAPIIVEALDSAGNIVGYGKTPALSLAPVDQGPFAVWVGRPGSIAAAKAVLPSPRTEMAAAGAVGLGALFAGGRDANGTVLTSTAVYDIYTQQMIVVKDLTVPRAAASAIPTSPRVVVFGGAQASGFGATGGALDTGELFDPSGGGLWAAVPADSAPAAGSRATTVVLGSGSGFVSGGFAADGSRIGTALLVSTGGTTRITPIMMPMVAARADHAVAAARFPDGDGALLIGGLADGDPGPVVERLIGQSFTTYTADGVENRRGASATSVAGGVLLCGGDVPGAGGRVATTSCVFIPTDMPGTPDRYDSLLPTARSRHTATKIDDDLLLCGGVDQNGVPIASCDLIGTNPIAWKRTIVMGTGRVGHVAVPLETGPVLLAGGTGAGGAALDSIEIYTP